MVGIIYNLHRDDFRIPTFQKYRNMSSEGESKDDETKKPAKALDEKDIALLKTYVCALFNIILLLLLFDFLHDI